MKKEKNEWKTTSRYLQLLKMKVIVAFEDETTIAQKPCIRSPDF